MTGEQFLGFDFLTGEQKLVRHLAENQACGEGGHGEDGRAAEHGSQRTGELGVGYRAGRHEIHGTRKLIGLQDVIHAADPILNVNPTPPLPAIADVAAEPEAKGTKHLVQGAAGCAQHESSAHVNRPDTYVDRWRGRPLPLPAYSGKKIIAGGTVFSQQFITAIAV